MNPTSIISTKELAKLTAGGDSYIRTKNNVVKGLAITKKKNPDAPRIITVSNKGPRIVNNAKILAKTKEAIPTYIKLGVNQWMFKGNYKVVSFSQEKSDISEHHGNRPVEEIYGILFMEKEE